jgi:thioredoxin reductase (NADPH)
VVGGGDNAIESALGLAGQDGTTVTLSYRGQRFSRIRDRLRVRIEEAERTGSVTVLLNSRVTRILSDVVVLDVDGQARIIPNDDVVVRIGGEPPSAFLEALGVRMVHKEVPVAPEDVANAS